MSAPCAEASDMSRWIFSRPSSSDDATPGVARAMIMESAHAKTDQRSEKTACWFVGAALGIWTSRSLEPMGNHSVLSLLVANLLKGSDHRKVSRVGVAVDAPHSGVLQRTR